MALRPSWLWPRSPIGGRHSENLLLGRDITKPVEVQPGYEITLVSPSTPSLSERYGYRPSRPSGRRRMTFEQHDPGSCDLRYNAQAVVFYAPTPQELEVVARWSPSDEPGNPNWIRIEDALLAARRTKTELRQVAVVTLIRWLDESLPKCVSSSGEQATALVPDAARRDSKVESKAKVAEMVGNQVAYALIDIVADGKPFVTGQSLEGVAPDMLSNMLRCGQATFEPLDAATLTRKAESKRVVSWPLYPFGVRPEASLYSPTVPELEVVARWSPRDEPGNPSWIRLEDALLAAGRTKMELRQATVVTLIRWLDESLTKGELVRDDPEAKVAELIDEQAEVKPLTKPPAVPIRGRTKGTSQYDTKKDQRLFEAWKSGQYPSKNAVDVEFKEPHGTTHDAIERHRKRVQTPRKK